MKISTVIHKIKGFLKKPVTVKVLKISAIAIPAILIVFFGIRYYLIFREKTRDPWDFVPDNPVSIVQVNNMQEFVHAVTSEPLFADFENLLSASEIRNTFTMFDSLFATKEQIQEAWYQGTMLIGTHFMGSDNYSTIFIKPLSHPNDKHKVFQFFEKHADQTGSIELQGENAPVYQYVFGSKKYILSIEGGICLFSTTPEIIRSALIASRSKSPVLNDPALNEVRSVTGKTCMANVFVHYRFLHRFFSKYLNGDVLKTLDVINNFASWGSYDIHTGDGKLFCTGFTSTTGMENSWLGVFKESKPQKTDIVEFLPFTTCSFSWFGFDNYETFREAYKHYLSQNDEIQEFNNNLTNLKRRTGVQNINELVFPYIDNQMAVFSIPDKSDRSFQQFGIFKIKDKTIFRKNLQEIVRSVAKITKTSPDTSSYRNHLITTINADYMLFDLFGRMFNSVEKTCFVIYENYWIIGNSHDAVKEYLNQVMSGRILTKQPMYEEFSKSVSGDANVYIYSSPRKIKNLIKLWFNEEYTEQVVQNMNEFDALEGIGIQFSSTTNSFLSGFSLFRNSGENEEMTSGWEISIDGQVASGPWFVEVSDQSTRNIIVFDAFNNMYFITEKGEILWKLPLPERPVSKVFVVDAFKNGKLQYLFNTETNLYLIDKNGKNVEKFPVKLPVQAAGPINVFDYDKSKEYRILFTGTDNILYNLTLKGEPTSGWEKPNLKTEASQPINHLRLINTDALIIKDNKFQLHFFNRRGIYLFDKKDIAFSQYSEIYAASKLCRCFITTTSDGQIAKIGTSGELEYSVIHDAGPGHVFMFQDIDKDGQEDYIFIEKGKAYMFSQEGNLISGAEIGQDAGRSAGYIKDSPYGPLLYVFSSDGAELYFVNKSGRILPDETYYASGSADYYLSSDGSKLVFITAKGNLVYMYVIE